jgi:peptidoglycan DL-endopeptidase CwlO
MHVLQPHFGWPLKLATVRNPWYRPRLVTYRPHPVRPSRIPAKGRFRRQGLAPYVLAGICLALVAALPALSDPSIRTKQAEAAAVLARLNGLEASLEPAIQRYDLAKLKLARVQQNLRENRMEGTVARHNLEASQRAMAARLVSLYKSGQSSTLEVILGAKNLDDMMSRIAAAKSVTSLDASVVGQVRHFRTALQRSRRQLAHARKQQNVLVASLAAQKRAIEGRIAQQNSLVSSLRGEIAHLQAEQAARQLTMAREVAARLQAAQLAAANTTNQTAVGVTAAAPSGQTFVPPSSHSSVVNIALAQVGKPYVWAAAGPDSFDCSGLIVYSFAQLGISLPHSSYALWDLGVPVSEDQLEPGDLVFFDGLGHVGMYVGGGEFVQAPHTGTDVQVTPLASYQDAYVGARRIL